MARLLDLPHHDARRLVRAGAPVYLTFNPVEYHGPHLPLGCDELIARGILGDLTARMEARYPDWPVLVVDPMDMGVQATSGPGSRRERYLHVRRTVRETCRALVELGARRAVLNTFHGSPLHNVALQEGVEVFQSSGGQAMAPFNIVLNEMVDLDPESYAPAFEHIEDEAVRREMLEGLPLDVHAGFFETSMAMHYAPDSVSPRVGELPPCPPFDRNLPLAILSKIVGAFGARRTAAEMRFASQAAGWVHLRPFPAYTSRPEHAAASAGAFFAARLLEKYEAAVERVFDDGEPPPAPIMRWIEPLTLWGRLWTTYVPQHHVADDLLPDGGD